MRLRALVAGAGLVAATGLAVTAPSASAVCDPDFAPLCLSPCLTRLVDVTDPDVKETVQRLFYACPA